MKAAQLSSSLLMRKGSATPVPGFTNYSASAGHAAPAERKDEKRERPQLREAARQTREAREDAEIQAHSESLKRDRFGRVRMSIRLDSHRHLRLKLLAAHSRLSVQETMIAALDAYLDGMGQCINGGSCSCLSEGGGCTAETCGQASGGERESA